MVSSLTRPLGPCPGSCPGGVGVRGPAGSASSGPVPGTGWFPDVPLSALGPRPQPFL